jgi:hypothetical protein
MYNAMSVEQKEMYCRPRNTHMMVASYARFSPNEKKISPPPKKIERKTHLIKPNLT